MFEGRPNGRLISFFGLKSLKIPQNITLYICIYMYIHISIKRCTKIAGYSQEYQGIPLDPPLIWSHVVLASCMNVCVCIYLGYVSLLLACAMIISPPSTKESNSRIYVTQTFLSLTNLII